jgi:hypothetical protein
MYECGRCGGAYREGDVKTHAENAHHVSVEEIDFSPIPEWGNNA